MPSKTPKKTTRSGTRRNKTKTNYKKKILSIFPSGLLRSTLFLYIVFFVALLDILTLWQKKDNESIFLFILIAWIVYIQQKNMILVLGVPLVIVNLLVFLRAMFRKQGEGFVDYETYNPYNFQEFIFTYIQGDDDEYTNYTENINDTFGSLFERIDMVVKNPLSSEDDTNTQYINELKDFLVSIDAMSEDDPLYDNEQVVYIRRMIRRFKDDMNPERDVDEPPTTMEDDMSPERDLNESPTTMEDDTDLRKKKSDISSELKELNKTLKMAMEKSDIMTSLS